MFLFGLSLSLSLCPFWVGNLEVVRTYLKSFLSRVQRFVSVTSRLLFSLCRINVFWGKADNTHLDTNTLRRFFEISGVKRGEFASSVVASRFSPVDNVRRLLIKKFT